MKTTTKKNTLRAASASTTKTSIQEVCLGLQTKAADEATRSAGIIEKLTQKGWEIPDGIQEDYDRLVKDWEFWGLMASGRLQIGYENKQGVISTKTIRVKFVGKGGAFFKATVEKAWKQGKKGEWIETRGSTKLLSFATKGVKAFRAV